MSSLTIAAVPLEDGSQAVAEWRKGEGYVTGYYLVGGNRLFDKKTYATAQAALRRVIRLIDWYHTR